MNKVKYLSIVIVIFAVLTMACKSNPNLYVASKQVDCVGAGPQKCLLVKENKDENWTYLYDNIQGFNYEPGYEYELIIKKRISLTLRQMRLRFVISW